ncbi:MAG: hypothetical protein ABF709_05165 [Leuconostoc pseudomesenteroides]|uniref:hypothetical protein n=1 Tax=Leuconostoc pseudomesenteroides TaxID=33968 RepID=UPI001E64D1A0|nr:hypothetical protein [Leuconostoc pseudomesenteroides]MCC7668894.1 hypothetical protein [Leuconostoc pseudomesenteroides]
MKLKEMQGLEWLIRDINDDLRIVFKYEASLVSATFLLKQGSVFATSETVDFEYVSSDSEIKELEEISRKLFQSNRGDDYSKPESVSPYVFNKIISAVDQARLENDFQLTPTDVFFFNSKTKLPFLNFGKNFDFNPVSVIAVAKQV